MCKRWTNAAKLQRVTDIPPYRCAHVSCGSSSVLNVNRQYKSGFKPIGKLSYGRYLQGWLHAGMELPCVARAI